VKLTAQLAVPPLPLSVQLAVVGETPAPLAPNETLPVGVVTVPGEASLTVAVHVLESPTAMGLLQLKPVAVARALMVIEPPPELVSCVESAWYDAVTFTVPVALAVKLAEQVAEVPLPLNEQLVLVGETPAPLAVRFTVPVGAVAPVDVSVTVIVQLDATPTTAATQLTPVVVVCSATLIEPLPELVLCVVSPAYEADTEIEPLVLPVKLAEQVANVPEPLNVQLVLAGDTPAPLAVRLTVPVGAVALAAVSVTVTVQLLATPGSAGLVQLTPVLVACNTVSVDVPVLGACVASKS